MIRRNRCTQMGAIHGSGYLLITGLLLSISSAAFGWAGTNHSLLAENIFNDAAIAPFVTEFNIDKNAVTSWIFEPSGWHPHDSFFASRGYLGTFGGNDWTSLSETTRLRYLTHVIMDSGVPVHHLPAGTVYDDSFNEDILEAQAVFWSSTPTVVSDSYSGTFSQANATFISEQIANALAYKATRNWLGLHSTDDNVLYGKTGMKLALKRGRAVLTDYFLAKRDTIAEAGSAYAVTPGGSATFSSAGSQDPDSITWNSNATYYNNGGGISSVEWDVDNDGQYDDASGSSANLTHAQLVSLVGYSETAKTIAVRVTDNEGKSATDTSTVRVFSDPTVNATATYTTLKQNQKLYLKSSGSDADGGSVVSYAWDLDNDGQYDDATTANPEISYSTLTNLGLSAGNNYTISVRGIDNDGAYAGQATDSFTLTMDTSYNIATQAVATASSQYEYDPNLVAGKVNDGIIVADPWYSTVWASNSEEDHWIKLEWDEEILFDEVKLYSIGYSAPQHAPAYTTADFLIQIWDGDSWETIDSVVDNTDTVYVFDSETVYMTDALRIYITDSNYTDTIARLLEIEVGLYDGGQQIPEPVTLVTLALGGTCCFRRRKN